MPRRATTTICLALAATAALAAPAAADAKAKKPVPVPEITRVMPMRVEVGELLTLRGKNFNRKLQRNTVVFRGGDGRSAFVKPRRASKTRLVLRIPASVARLLAVRDGAQRPTRLKLRVLTRKFSAFTPRRLSPVVLGVGGKADGPGGKDGKDGGDGKVTPPVCNKGVDHDGDLLSNDLELALGTDRCLPDTDGDSMTDGWEYFSALDLNIKAVPYPGKRPYPNALDPTDGGVGVSAWDFDGDGLTTAEEYRAWRVTGSSFLAEKIGGLGLESPLGYSDGTKFSRASETPGVPAWRGPLYGLPAPAQPFPATYDFHQDPLSWRDDERDADGDGLSNWIESARGPGKPAWWAGFWASLDPAAKPWGEPATDCDVTQQFGYFDQRPFAELDLADPDADGDTLLDGEDDQDNDDFINIVELYEVLVDLDADGGYSCLGETYPSLTIDLGDGLEPRGINPFNPCAPNPGSRTCHDYTPF